MAKFEFSESGCTFIPDLTIAREDDLHDFADEFETFAGRVTGNAGDVFQQFDGAASEFSEVFAWKITDEAGYDERKWQDAAMAALFLVGVTP